MILGSTDGGKPPLAAVDVEDALHVGLRLARVNTERGLSWTSSLSVSLSTSLLPSKATWLMTGFSTTVTTHAGALAVDAHVGEQAGGEQRLDRLVDLAGIVGVADVELEIGAHRLRLDAPVAATRISRIASPLCACGSLRAAHEHRLDDGHGKNAAAATRIEVPAPRLAHPYFEAFVPSAFQFAVPSCTLPVGVRWALTARSLRSQP